MKSYKICKVLSVIALICFLMISLFSVSAFAAEESVEASESTTLITRIWEWVLANKDQLIDKTIDAVTLALVLIFNVMYKKLKTNVLSIGVTTGNVEESQKESIGAINSLGENVEKYTDIVHADINGAVAVFKEEISELKKLLDEEIARANTLGAVAAEATTILEILMTVYPASKNLPQGIKDIVELKYANCLKTINNDEKLSAIMTSIHNVINDPSTEESNNDEPC